jgi:putative membrane protein
MGDTPYSKFSADELILRDELAVDRTLLANERTLLAYLRSAVALVIAGVTIVQFSDQGWFWVFGVVCIPTGLVTGAFGIYRFRTMGRSIRVLRSQAKTSA